MDKKQINKQMNEKGLFTYWARAPERWGLFEHEDT